MRLRPGGPLEQAYAAAIASMTTLNADAARVALAASASAATDVTGFGLLGHLHKLALASGVEARIHVDAVPRLPGRGGAAGRRPRARRDRPQPGVRAAVPRSVRRAGRWTARRAACRRATAAGPLALDDPSTRRAGRRSWRCSPTRRRRVGCSSPARPSVPPTPSPSCGPAGHPGRGRRGAGGRHARPPVARLTVAEGRARPNIAVQRPGRARRSAHASHQSVPV